jgi:dihydroflavonol-4-reductase
MSVRKALVTGATGFLGSHIVQALIAKDIHCVALHRAASNKELLHGMDVEWREGDVRDAPTLESAMAGCDTVFHTAAVVSFWGKKREVQFEVNVTGTRNVVNTCLSAGVKKLVHTSSVAALGFRPDGGLIDETTVYNWGPDIGYKYSKHLAEKEILAGVKQGLDAVMVNPSVIVGGGDIAVHGGQLVLDIARGKVPGYTAGGMNVVAVHDVVHGHIAAAEHGQAGERYILGGENLTHKAVFELAAKVSCARAPRINVPIPFVKLFAKTCDLYGAVTGREPMITSELVSGVGANNWYSSDKAERELGYSPGPVEPAFREAYEWYRSRKLI